MIRAMHRPTAQVRRISGRRGETVHFAQCIKADGETFYWADAAEAVAEIEKSLTNIETAIRQSRTAP